MLSKDEIKQYHDDGYVLAKQVVSPEQLSKLQTMTYELIEGSRKVSESNHIYDLDEGHSEHSPRLNRIKLPHKLDPYFWDILEQSEITSVLKSLLGNNIQLQTSKLNTKAPDGGSSVEWHQDVAFYPLTNDSVLAVGLMLEDVTHENGPLQVIPKSHKGPTLDHSNDQGLFCGAIDPDDPDFDKEKIVTITGKAGDMSIHHGRILHGSAPNRSDRARLMLFYECNAADAWPLLGGAAVTIQKLGSGELWEDLHVRTIAGRPTKEPRIENWPVRMPVPPLKVGGSIFKTQKSGGARSFYD
ncbi:MAG: phytanoyl-CoA dioxygenase [Planktomarina sp.]|nr:phytanoyl-CoA dioxygenase [Planktomarina sp.]